MSKKWVYLFEELSQAEESVKGDWDKVRALLGGKGANLADMFRLQVPVPAGFTVTTEACNRYLGADSHFADGIWEQELEALKSLEIKTGKKFGDPLNPLLVSCRSGSKFSMPGMMDTVLDIGLNDETVTGIARLTGNELFAYDSYRRLIQMFGSVVMGIHDEEFENVLTEARNENKIESDSDFNIEALKKITTRFKAVFKQKAWREFPQDPIEQISLATEAVFKSWNGKRAFDYRNAENIPHDLGTAVNIVSMVFGNLGNKSATGVVTTRNVSTGERDLEGDFLINAQGEDVVAGIRTTMEISLLKKENPEIYSELIIICKNLEKHYKNVQDIEFTIENGKLWILQTRDAKRTAQAAVRIAVEMAEEWIITKEQAVMRVTPEQIDFFLHPQFDQQAKKEASEKGFYFTKGLNVSPGAAVGQIAYDADLAVKWAAEGKKVIMVRPETKPDDVHGMLAAKGILTSRGGRTSHAALVARQFGKPAIVGATDIKIDLVRRLMKIDSVEVGEGEVISIDGNTGEVFLGEIKTVIPDIKDPYLLKLLHWADECRKLQVWANADYPADAQRAKDNGAQGIGLCRTEHMFFQTDRLPYIQKMILAQEEAIRQESLNALLPFQREDFIGLFRVMNGMPVVIRLIDPPLHEFLPTVSDLLLELSDLKIQLLTDSKDLKRLDDLLFKINQKKVLLEQVKSLAEQNPMLGLRGVRLGICLSALTRMQVRAIIEAACIVTKEGIKVHPKIMIPLTSHVNELTYQKNLLEEEAKLVMLEKGLVIDYKFGTMIEIPRAALISDELAVHSEFFSFGTNDLTQTTFGISRDDGEKGFLIKYLELGILKENPFQTIDTEGVGKIMIQSIELGRKTRSDLEIGVCGEHGGDPKSIHFFHKIGLDYVSCSPFRVPIARLAAAQIALKEKGISAK